jgi:hypothetical protein
MLDRVVSFQVHVNKFQIICFLKLSIAPVASTLIV